MLGLKLIHVSKSDQSAFPGFAKWKFDRFYWCVIASTINYDDSRFYLLPRSNEQTGHRVTECGNIIHDLITLLVIVKLTHIWSVCASNMCLSKHNEHTIFILNDLSQIWCQKLHKRVRHPWSPSSNGGSDCRWSIFRNFNNTGIVLPAQRVYFHWELVGSHFE